jgi:4-hydroxythreonine-4-phosphate dehydrogenase
MQDFGDPKLSGNQSIRRPLVVTRGDPSGIGLELTLKAWAATHAQSSSERFFVVANPDHLAALAVDMKLDVPVEPVASAAQASASFARALPVWPQTARVIGELGRPDVADAPATIASIETAVELVKAGQASAVVTNPIAKEVLYRAGFAHAGHTEFLSELARHIFNIDARPVMMLWSPQLAVVPTTIHIPLAQVVQKLNSALIIETAHIVARDLRTRFGVLTPRLAFTGLNPHAGEGGDMGSEEIEIITPALEALKTAGLDVSGPHPADTLFHPAARKTYDVVIAMYHDQALIPIKTIAFDSAVNVTLGLPFIRTSPDHGTAFDIAEKFIANPASLIAALELAGKMQRHFAC